MDFTQRTDEELVEIAKVNGEGLETIINRYKNMVNSFARSYFLADGDVDDLIQEGLVGLFKAVTTYNGKAKFCSHAYTCIKTSILTAVKKSNRLKNLPLVNYISLTGSTEDFGDKTDIIEDASFGPEDTYINAETFRELTNTIEKSLSNYEFKILSLYLKGYSYEDIANKSEKSVKSIDNALQRIRKKLAVAVTIG